MVASDWVDAFAMTSDGAPPARRLGPYELREAIGHGGSAVVYRARDTRAEASVADVAVKVIGGSHAANPEFQARFRQEASLISRLQHRHILRLLDSGESVPGRAVRRRGEGNANLASGYAYLVTEYCPGGGLDLLMRRDRSVRDRCRFAADVAEQIGAGLDAAHDVGILHRDVKPSNILVARDGRYVLGDFGLARVLRDGPSLHLTITGHVTGTPAYMAPEQAAGESADERTDLYALGVVLFEIIAGVVPFRADNAMAVMLAHVHQPPPWASDIAAGVPGAVSEVLTRTLAKDREARFPTGASLATALRNVVGTRGDLPSLPEPVRPPGTGARGVDVGLAMRGDNRGGAEGLRTSGERTTDTPTRSDRAARAPGSRTGLSGLRIVLGGVVIAALATVGLFLFALAGDAEADRSPDGLFGVSARLRQVFDTLRGTDDGPTVTEALMPPATRPAPIRPAVTIRFSQPMDVVSVETSLRFDPAVTLDFEWNGQLVVVTPRQDLVPGGTYTVVLATTARGADGRPLVRALDHRFTTRTLADVAPGIPTAAPERIVPGVPTPTPVRPAPSPVRAVAPTVRPSVVASASPIATRSPTLAPTSTAIILPTDVARVDVATTGPAMPLTLVAVSDQPVVTRAPGLTPSVSSMSPVVVVATPMIVGPMPTVTLVNLATPTVGPPRTSTLEGGTPGVLRPSPTFPPAGSSVTPGATVTPFVVLLAPTTVATSTLTAISTPATRTPVVVPPTITGPPPSPTIALMVTRPPATVTVTAAGPPTPTELPTPSA